MGRMTGILAILFLAACEDGTIKQVDLLVTNNGSESVHVFGSSTNYDGEVNHKHSFDLAPGESGTATFSSVMWLDVMITRISDHALIFSADWSTDEIKDLGNKVAVTVFP